MIKVENLTKQFADTVAVDQISFDVKKGEILGFLGPNGAGKTTTMRMLTCFMPPTSGTARVAGHDIYKDSLAVRKVVGYLPENVPLYHEMRVSEYLMFRSKLKRVPRGDRKRQIAESLEKCGLVDVERKIIGHLSKGFRQRVGLADVLLHDPQILILDEPTIGLDPNQIRQVRQLIKDLGKDHTVILSTHILPEVEIICDRVIIINKGKVVAQDTPEGLEKLFHSTGKISLEVRGPAEKVKNALETIDGVSGVFWQDRGEFSSFRIETEKGRDLREDVFKKIVQNDWILRELKSEAMSLEDIFVQITAE